jgi:WD40 repeat protein
MPLDVGRSVGSVAFGRGGKTLAAGYRGGVMLWDVEGSARLIDKSLVVREEGVRAVAFSPNGVTLAAGYNGPGQGWDGEVTLWDTDLNSWRNQAVLIANRALTRDELRNFFSNLPEPPEERPGAGPVPAGEAKGDLKLAPR